MKFIPKFGKLSKSIFEADKNLFNLTVILYCCNIVNMQVQTYEETVKLQGRGILTIPKKMREGLFDETGIVKMKRVGRQLIITPIKTLAYPVRSYTESELQDFFDLDAKETKELKTKGLI